MSWVVVRRPESTLAQRLVAQILVLQGTVTITALRMTNVPFGASNRMAEVKHVSFMEPELLSPLSVAGILVSVDLASEETKLLPNLYCFSLS